MSDDDFSRDEGQSYRETQAPGAFASHPISEGSATCRVTPNKSLPILPLLNEATANELLTPRFAVPEPRPLTSESGQFLAASHGRDAADAHPKTSGDGHKNSDDLAADAIDARSLSETAGHAPSATLLQAARLSTPSDAIRAALCKDIREAYHKRRDLMEAEKRLTLQIKALCRREVGGDLKLAGELYAEIDKQAFTTPEAEALYQHAEPLLHARSYISKAKKLPEKELTKMAHHRRSLRYMEKRLLRNLWRAWRDLGGEAKPAEAPKVPMPHSQPFCDAEAAPVLSPKSMELLHRTPSTGLEADRYLSPPRSVLPVLPISAE